MTRKRRRFSQEFKVEAVRMIIDGGSSIAALARDLGVSANGLRRWKKQYEADAQEAFPGNGRVHSRDEELRRLQREVVVLRQERDILKKAALSSTGHRNIRVQFICWRTELQCFSRSLI